MYLNFRVMPRYRLVALLLLLPILNACGGGGGNNNHLTPPPSTFSFSLSSASLKLFHGGSSDKVDVTVTRNGSTASLSLAVSGLPAVATALISDIGTGNTGSISITPVTAAAGTYNLTVKVSDATTSVSHPLTLTVGASTVIAKTSSGTLDLFMSTSFQPAEWDYQFFQNFPASTTPLTNLGPQHIRLQAISQGVPQTSPTTWDFTKLDAIANPVFTTADHDPEFQIAVAPAFMYDANHKLADLTFQQFADYSTQLVRYYNTGGFTAADGTHASSAGYPITYWGIFNEPNINNLTPAEYTALYNKTVPAMHAVDPAIRFVAVELADFGSENTRYMPTFVNNVTAQVDVVATHYYGSCNQKDTDSQLFNNVPDFANRVSYLYSQLATNPVLANVPVWITENNVNADFDKGGGVSACNGTAFTHDARGSSAYFAAWRPYMFSQVGKVGARGLYHWVFASDVQYGELNDQTGHPRLSYWVDYWLGHYFPSPPGAQILDNSSTDDAELETLAVQNPDGSFVVMIANHAMASPNDNNGAGAPRSILLDISQLTTSTAGKLLTIDTRTDLVNGPAESSILLTPTVQIDFPGYGVAFLSFK
jgi:hypothetical protein